MWQHDAIFDTHDPRVESITDLVQSTDQAAHIGLGLLPAALLIASL
ncbi:hypothetical protein [Kitasatospora griseola]